LPLLYFIIFKIHETGTKSITPSSGVISLTDKTVVNAQNDINILAADSKINISNTTTTLPSNVGPLQNNLTNVTATEQTVQASADIDNTTQTAAVERPINSQAIFTFAGDCWVNIHDAKGERIAYGVKKSGYVMELNGIAPFKVTVGKPELVSITLNGESVDMAKYKVGNIAKFTLPENS